MWVLDRPGSDHRSCSFCCQDALESVLEAVAKLDQDGSGAIPCHRLFKLLEDLGNSRVQIEQVFRELGELGEAIDYRRFFAFLFGHAEPLAASDGAQRGQMAQSQMLVMKHASEIKQKTDKIRELQQQVQDQEDQIHKQAAEIVAMGELLQEQAKRIADLERSKPVLSGDVTGACTYRGCLKRLRRPFRVPSFFLVVRH